MTGIIAGVKGKRAVLLNNDGEFIEIADRGYEVGQKIDYKKPSISAKYAYIAACFILLMFVGFSSYAAYFTSVSFISIDINPSFRIDINRFDRVISVKPLNDDARQLLELNKVKALI